MIIAGIPDAQVTVKDLTGTGDHFRADVVSPSFRDKSRVEQHQMVYKAIGNHMGGAVHALQLFTKTP